MYYDHILIIIKAKAKKAIKAKVVGSWLDEWWKMDKWWMNGSILVDKDFN